MPFDAECTFCRLTLQHVPDERMGCSVRCPRCGDNFTLAPMTKPATTATSGPRSARRRKSASSVPAVVEAPIEAPPALPSAAEPEPAKKQLSAAAATSLASFVLGSGAFLLAALTHVNLISFVLGAVGLLVGVLALLSWAWRSRRPFVAATGPLVNMAAVILTAFFPNLLGLEPLWSERRPAPRAENAVISLSGMGGFRDAAQEQSSWVDASRDALHRGDVRVRILSAWAGRVDLEPRAGKKTPEYYGLMVRVRINNAGITREISYTSWSDLGPQHAPLLHDDQGRSYAMKKIDAAWVVKGRARNSTIPSGKSLEDLLVFEAPPSTIAFLHLDLPASAAGAEGRFRFEIPRTTIVFR